MAKGRERVKWQAKERARLVRQAKPSRDEFAREFSFCWHCGATWNLCVDEIVSGMSDRVKGVQHRLAWTRLCGHCNEFVLNGSSQRVLITKLALKFVFDREHFDLAAVNMLRGRCPGAILLQELVPTICRRLDGGRYA